MEYPDLDRKLTHRPISNRQRWLRRLAVIATVFTVMVVLKGAYTRLVDAGLGCPDWPGCYGFLTVPTTDTKIALAEARFPHAPVDTSKGWPEMIHRYLASTLGLLIIGLAALAWKRDAEEIRPRKHTLALLGLVILQGLFGMWTVTLQLWPQVVTGHLLGGFATLSVLFLLTLRLYARPRAVVDDVRQQALRQKAWIVVSLAAVVVQIALGGWLSSNYAAVACPDFPTCQGSLWPPMDFKEGFNVFQHIGPNYLGGLMDNEARVAIHMTHRLGAVVVTALILLTCWRLWKLAPAAGMRPCILVVGALLATQIALGITNVVALLPLGVAVAHNGVAALLLLALIWTLYRLTTLEGHSR